MADWSQPTLTSTYTNFLDGLTTRDVDLAVGLDPAITTVTNPPTNAIRWNSANGYWEKYSGTAWAALATTYAISVAGNAATATKLAAAQTINGVNFDGSTAITITANTPNSLTFNSAGTGGASGTTFNGSVAQTISYNTIGAPSATGANASGTWGISISGNAATATVLATARAINGVSFDGSAAITITANTPNAVTFNNAGTGAASGTTFNGSAAQTISYNTIGAPSTTGTNASGTWGISISGNAATATSATTAGSIANAGGWNVTPNGTKLYLNYNGTNIGSIDSSGNFIAKGNVTAYGTP